jgi:prophage antirepressor-like protein
MLINKIEIHLKILLKKYKDLYKNVQGHTIFISEAGLYSLIFASKMNEAKEIRNWITDEVLPKIREFGEYKVTENKKNS